MTNLPKQDSVKGAPAAGKPSTDWQKLAEERLDGWQRERASFENYRKQMLKAKEEIVSFATAELVARLTPVMHNFELAIKHAPKVEDDKEVENWLQGVLQIQKELKAVLTERGVEEIRPKKGEKFDPNFHEAVTGVAAAGLKQGEVAELLEPGYKLNDRLIKPARVSIGQ